MHKKMSEIFLKMIRLKRGIMSKNKKEPKSEIRNFEIKKEKKEKGETPSQSSCEWNYF